MEDLALPKPDSEELEALLPGRVHRVIYRFMYEHRDVGLTRPELRVLVEPEVGAQEQLDRRARSLNKKFVIEKVRDGREVRHKLVSLRADPGADLDDGISGAQRYRALESGKCNICGKTPVDDGVKLVVDHITPRDLGGPSEDWNLQPLCEQCNAEKKERFSAFNEHREEIREAMAHDDVVVRIGEVLKAFHPDPVPADVLQVVASGGTYRNDWERRFRDLRGLGWKVHVKKIHLEDRISAEYSVEEWMPWK